MSCFGVNQHYPHPQTAGQDLVEASAELRLVSLSDRLNLVTLYPSLLSPFPSGSERTAWGQPVGAWLSQHAAGAELPVQTARGLSCLRGKWRVARVEAAAGLQNQASLSKGPWNLRLQSH